MGGLKAAVTAVCCGAFLCGIISLFLKNSGVSKTAKFTLSLFLCACVALPILNVNFSDLKQPDFSGFSGECSINTELDSFVEQRTRAIREQTAVKEIISLSFEKDGYARLVVSGCDETAMGSIEEKIKTATGYTAEVTK